MHTIRLASNENPFGPSPRAMEAIRVAAAEVNLYPDNSNSKLRRLLAELHGVAAEQILISNGTTSLLHLMARALLAPGLNAVTSRESFIVYPAATREARADLIETPTVEHGYALEAIAAAVNRSTRLVFIANPNNPTGTMVDAPAVERFLQRVPEHVTVVLDEAYAEFAAAFAARRGAEYTRSLEYLRQGRNVIVQRTFSKAHGLAGIRVGYGIGPAELIGRIARLRVTFDVSRLAEAAALAALSDHEHIRKTVDNNCEQAAWLARNLQELGFRPVPTWANFICFDAGEPAAALARRLASHGVLVHAMNEWGMPNAVRVTIGTPEQNQAFIAALERARNDGGGTFPALQ